VPNDPLNGRNTHGVSKSKKSLVQAHSDLVAIWHPLKASAFPRAQEPHLVLPETRFEKNLSPAPSTWSTKASSDPVSAKFRHALAMPHSTEGRTVCDMPLSNHQLRTQSMVWAHLAHEVLRSLLAPPLGIVIGQIL
jgi:hypothetical protein